MTQLAFEHNHSSEYEDPQWRGSFTAALEEAAQLGRPVVVKPTGQGFCLESEKDTW